MDTSAAVAVLLAQEPPALPHPLLVQALNTNKVIVIFIAIAINQMFGFLWLNVLFLLLDDI